MSVCMRACVHMSVCMRACVHMSVCMRACVHMSVCMRACISCISELLLVYVYVCLCVCLSVCMYVCIIISTFRSKLILVHTDTDLYEEQIRSIGHMRRRIHACHTDTDLYEEQIRSISMVEQAFSGEQRQCRRVPPQKKKSGSWYIDSIGTMY